ncbi:MAG: ABC transporter ATP-binding protein [Mariniblastus sp.]|nr:ABC transporter ATP-binding protein [Mariniblastus sp.]
METILHVTDLSHRYANPAGDRVVLEHLDLDVQAGQLVGLLGESGAGKTTLLLNCGTMLRPTAGRVEIKGRSVYQLADTEKAQVRSRQIGYLFQTLQLIPYLTLRDNLRLPAGSSNDRADAWLDRVGLTDWALHKPDALSHGQRQRGALARALVHQPDLVIADEPTGNLDRQNSELVFRVLRDYADAGGAVLVASHDERIDAHADHCWSLQEGALKEVSPQP